MYKPYETMPADIKQKVFTPDIRGFIEFARTKDPKERYDWACPFNCAAGQFNKAMGEPACSDHSAIFGGNLNYHYICSGTAWDNKSLDDWTFGAALKRAEEVLARG